MEETIMKKLLSLVLASALVLSLTACGGGSSTASTTAAATTAAATEAATEAPAETEAAAEAPAESYEPITLNVAYMPNYGSLWAITTAQNLGILEKYGISVNLYEFDNGPNIIAAMESGSIDVGYIGHGAHKLCIQGKAKIFALSHISNGDAVIGGEGITKLEDLKGKTVAYTGGSSSEDILVNALNKAGLTMNDITPMDMDSANIVTAYLSGSVDACAIWSPLSLKILEQDPKATRLCGNVDFSDTSISLASWIAMNDYAEKNYDVLLRFTKALYEAMDYAADGHFEEVAEYVANQTKTDYQSVFDQRGDAEWLTGKQVAEGAADGTVEGYYNIQQQSFLASGAVEKEVPVSDYVMLDLMVEAGK